MAFFLPAALNSKVALAVRSRIKWPMTSLLKKPAADGPRSCPAQTWLIVRPGWPAMVLICVAKRSPLAGLTGREKPPVT